MGICDAMASIVDINWAVKQCILIMLSATDSATNEKRYGGLVLRWEDKEQIFEERISDLSASYTTNKELLVEAVLILQFIGPVEIF